MQVSDCHPPRHAPLVAARPTATAGVASTPLDSLRSDPTLERLLSQPNVTDCDYSPDGKTLMLLAKTKDGTQIHLVDVATKRQRQLTHETGGIKSVVWISNHSLIFTEDRDGNEKTQIFRMATAPGSTPEALTDNPAAIHHFASLRDGQLLYASNERETGLFDTWIKDVESGEKRMIYRADAPGIYPRSFSPDHKSVLLSRSYANGRNDLLLCDVASGKTRNLTAHLGEGRFSNTRWTKGNGLSMITNAGRDTDNVAVLNTKTGKIKYMTDEPWCAETVKYTNGARYRVTCFNEDGYSRFHIFDRTGQHDIKVKGMPAGQVVAQDFTPDNKSMVFCLSQPTQPTSLWKVSLETGQVKPFLPTGRPVPSLSGTVAPQLVHYGTFDGKQIPAFLYSPAQHKPYPTIVYVHGGPEGQHRPAFDSTIQYLVKRGFQVLAPNVRGSEGYGREYAHADDVDKRMDSVEDVAAAARWLAASGRADRRQIAVMGGSYGGYMTLAQLAFHPELWAAGVDVVGMSNLETFLRNTGAWRRVNREAEYGSLSRDLDLLRRVSPLNSVDQMRAPVMVIQGANDPRVPQSEADQIVDHVRRQGGVAEYLLFKDEGHGIAKKPNRVKAYTAAADFLESHVKDNSTTVE